MVLSNYWGTEFTAELTEKTGKSRRHCPFIPLSPNINMHIPHTGLQTLPLVLIRLLCLSIKTFFTCGSFPFFSLPLHLIEQCHSWGLKGYKEIWIPYYCTYFPDKRLKGFINGGADHNIQGRGSVNQLENKEPVNKRTDGRGNQHSSPQLLWSI